MASNGGQTSSLQAATSGSFQPDRGRILAGNPMEDSMDEDFYDTNENLTRIDRSPDVSDVEESDSTSSKGGNQMEHNSTSNKNIQSGGITNANKENYPTNPSSKAKTATITPSVLRISSGRGGGRGGGRGAHQDRSYSIRIGDQNGDGIGGQQASTAYLASGISEVFPGGIANQRNGDNTSGRVTPVINNKRPPQPQTQGNEDEVQFMGTRSTQGGEIPLLNVFQRASNLISNTTPSVLKLLPEKDQPKLTSLQTYNYIAELHFNVPLSEKGLKQDTSKEYSIPTCLRQWIKRTREASAESLILLPYRDEMGGNPITHEDQIPNDDGEAISQYYHNHRVESNGVLKGMIRFTTVVPWVELKNARSKYFKWMLANKVYMRHTSFDADTVVLLGYLHGIHPDAARLVDITKELNERLDLKEGTAFQVTPRNLGVLDSQVTQARFGFRAIAVETDSKMAATVRESFFRLGDPKVEKYKWPVTGNSLFIPMFKTTSWTTEGIAAMAKLHSRTISQLEQIFIENIYDIDTPVTIREPGGTEQMRTIREAIQSATNSDGDEAVHSVHTSNRPAIIRVLVTPRNARQATDFFRNFHEQMRASLTPEDFHVVTQGKQIQMTSRIYESSDSKVYAGYAAALLRENPQDGQEVSVTSPQRKKSKMEISYSAMVKRKSPPKTEARRPEAGLAKGVEGEDSDSELEEYGDDFWEQKIQAGFTKLFGEQKPLRAEEMEHRMKELIDKQADETEKKLDEKFANLTTDLKALTEKENRKAKKHIGNLFDQQNQVLLNLTVSLQASLLQMHENIRDVASQTNTRLTHIETPRIDVLQTSVVARSKDKYRDSSSSDEGG